MLSAFDSSSPSGIAAAHGNRSNQTGGRRTLLCCAQNLAQATERARRLRLDEARPPLPSLAHAPLLSQMFPHLSLRMQLPLVLQKGVVAVPGPPRDASEHIPPVGLPPDVVTRLQAQRTTTYEVIAQTSDTLGGAVLEVLRRLSGAWEQGAVNARRHPQLLLKALAPLQCVLVPLTLHEAVCPVGWNVAARVAAGWLFHGCTSSKSVQRCPRCGDIVSGRPAT